MSKKKIIIAIVLFVFVSLTIFAFANPSEDEKLNEVKTNEVEKEKEEIEQDTLETEEVVISTPTVNKNTKTVFLNSNATKSLYNKKIKDLVNALVDMVLKANSKLDLNAAREFNRVNDVINSVNKLEDSKLKNELTLELSKILDILNDTTSPVVLINGESVKSYYNSNIIITVNDNSKTSIKSIKYNGNIINSIENYNEGNYEIIYIDASYNETKVVFNIDKTGVAIEGLNSDRIKYDGNGIKLSSRDTDIASVILERDGQIVNGYSLSDKIINIGDYKLTVSDYAGNITIVEFSIYKEILDFEVTTNKIIGYLYYDIDVNVLNTNVVSSDYEKVIEYYKYNLDTKRYERMNNRPSGISGMYRANIYLKSLNDLYQDSSIKVFDFVIKRDGYRDSRLQDYTFGRDMYTVNEAYFYNLDNDRNYTIDGNGKTLYQVQTEEFASYGYNPTDGFIFSSANGSLVTLKNFTITGTTLASDIDNSGVPVYDLGIGNSANVTIKNSEIGSIYTWTHNIINIENTNVKEIYAQTINLNTNMITISGTSVVDLIHINPSVNTIRSLALTVKSGATVHTLDLTGYTNYDGITIENGAIVDKVITDADGEISLADWKTTYGK